MSKEKLRKRIYDRMPADGSKYYPLPLTGAYLPAIAQYVFNSGDKVEKEIEKWKKQANLTSDELSDKHPLITKYGATKEKAVQILRNVAKQALALEDAKDVYLQMPQRTGTIKQARYFPSINNDKQSYPTYRSTYLSDPHIVEGYILPAVSNLKRGIINPKAKDGEGESGDIYSIGKSGKNANTTLPLAGHATVGYGIDPKQGEYVSYFDQWDVNMRGKPGGKDRVAKYIGGQPFNLYDRIYLDDYYGIDTAESFKQEKEQNPDTYYGGWLPEIKINE